MKKWKVWQGWWIAKEIWEGTEKDAVAWRRIGYLVEECVE